MSLQDNEYFNEQNEKQNDNFYDSMLDIVALAHNGEIKDLNKDQQFCQLLKETGAASDLPVVSKDEDHILNVINRQYRGFGNQTESQKNRQKTQERRRYNRTIKDLKQKINDTLSKQNSFDKQSFVKLTSPEEQISDEILKMSEFLKTDDKPHVLKIANKMLEFFDWSKIKENQTDLILVNDWFSQIAFTKILSQLNSFDPLSDFINPINYPKRYMGELLHRAKLAVDKPLEFFENYNFSGVGDFNLFVSLIISRKPLEIFEYYEQLFDYCQTNSWTKDNFTIEKYKMNSKLTLWWTTETFNTVKVLVNGYLFVINYSDIDINSHKGPSPGYSALFNLYERITSPNSPSVFMAENYKTEEHSKVVFSNRKTKQLALLKHLAKIAGVNLFKFVRFFRNNIPFLTYSQEKGYVFGRSYENIFRRSNKTIIEYNINNNVKVLNHYRSKQIEDALLNNSEFLTPDNMFWRSGIRGEYIPNFLRRLPSHVAFLSPISTSLEKLELSIQQQINQGSLTHLWYDLFCTIAYEESICIFPTVKKMHKFKRKLNTKKMFSNFENGKTYFDENAYYGIQDRNEYSDEWYKMSNEEKNCFIKDNGTKIIKKIEEGTETREDLILLSSLFSFVNRKARNVSGIRMFELLEMYKDNKEKYSCVLDVLKNRLGDSSVLTVSVAIYLSTAVFSDGTAIFLENLPWLTLDKKYWISYWKQLSNQIKNYFCLGSNLIDLDEWRYIQYVELMFGQYGGDAVNAIETIKQRVYVHTPKTLKFRNEYGITSTLTEKQDEKFCLGVCSEYWKLVFEQMFSKRKTLNGLEKNILNRAKFATNSSMSLGSHFFDSKIINDFLGTDVKTTSGNKNSVLNSETTKFFLRVITDLPVTISNMTLKPKELAKKRYIFGVSIQHYIINSALTLEFEPFFDKLGLKTRGNNMRGFSEMINDDETDIYNCLDYTEFNDQHEENFRKMIWVAFSNELSRYNLKNIPDYLLLSKWMEVACQTIWIQIPSATKNLYRHKGRLLSGERCTTLVNSLASVVYMARALWNLSFKNENLRVPKEMQNYYLLNPVRMLEMRQTLESNDIVGDDNRLRVKTFIEGIIINRELAMCGLVIRQDKCLLGYKMSEFLRLVNVHNSDINGHYGYPIRALCSLVAGNLEGAGSKHIYATLQEAYTSFNTVFIRFGNVGCLWDLFVKVTNRLTRHKVDRKGFKDIVSEPLNIKFLQLAKQQGGFGFVEFGTQEVGITKLQLTLPKREQSYRNKIKKDKVSTGVFEATRNALWNDSTALLGSYGAINLKNFEAEANIREYDIIESVLPKKVLYPLEWSIKYKESVEYINKNIDKINIIGFRDYFKFKNDKTVKEKVLTYISSKKYISNLGSSMAKVSDSIDTVLNVVDLNCTKKQFIIEKFGKKQFTFMEIRNEIKIPNFLNQIYDSGQFNNLLTDIIFNAGLLEYISEATCFIIEIFSSEHDRNLKGKGINPND